jgi:hypothetical protein
MRIRKKKKILSESVEFDVESEWTSPEFGFVY